MAEKYVPDHVSQLLDELARDAFTATEDGLRARLKDASVDPDLAVEKARGIGQSVVAKVRRDRIADLPEVVPDDPVAARELLNRLLAMPGAPVEGFTVAFRDGEEQSEHDERLLTGHLLELIKRNHGAS
jgi:hypothetical protein